VAQAEQLAVRAAALERRAAALAPLSDDPLRVPAPPPVTATTSAAAPHAAAVAAAQQRCEQLWADLVQVRGHLAPTHPHRERQTCLSGETEGDSVHVQVYQQGQTREGGAAPAPVTGGESEAARRLAVLRARQRRYEAELAQLADTATFTGACARA
jgi:hypothetical protein